LVIVVHRRSCGSDRYLAGRDREEEREEEGERVKEGTASIKGRNKKRKRGR
jgi:hypothetical protein